jgi:serine/threonine protein kinase/tetratricopeptide (TPR) repeat protein
MELSRGDKFDRYVIEELLGEGGMARVYRAHDPRLHRRVALKVLRLDSSFDPGGTQDALARVMREARAAAALDHPNAVSVFDVGEADGQLFIAMELVVGKSLRAYVSDPGVRWETKIRWMVEAARALGAAHDRGLVHRDVKPENVMVRTDGVVKVLDFGIAKRLRVDVSSPGALDESRTGSMQGGIVGTPMYLPPEHLRGEPVDGRGDQWAWGVMTYELLTGILPWPKGVGGFQLVLAILDKMPDPPSRYVGSLPSIVDATIMKTLSKSPAQRFEAMEFVVNALEGFTTSSRRSWAEIDLGATTKTDPAPPLDPTPVHTPAVITPPLPALSTGEATTLSSPKGRRLRWPPLAALAVALAAAGLLLYGRITRPDVLSASATPGAPAAPTSARGTLLTELPAGTHPPEALAAYRSFQQNLRDADWKAAIDALSTAVERDPSFGAGQLRLAFMRSLESVDEGQVRSTFMLAVRNRSTLDERDAALLDALAPYLQNDPSDPAECERRMAELRGRWPLDAEVAYMLGSVCYDRGELSCALEAFDGALGIDPGFALAASSRGGCLAYAGRADEARAALESATRLSPGATEPLWYLVELDEQQGRCADEEAHVRTWLSRDPSDWFGYDYLARALAAEGKPASTVLTAFEQKWVRLAPDHRAKIEPMDRAYLDVATGDFADAEQRIQELQRKLATESGAQAHAESQALLVRLAEESGQPARARAVAEEFLARKDAWAPSHRVDEVSIFLDAVPVMLGVLARVGGLTPAGLEQRRADWLGAWRTKTGASFQGDLWIAGWADPATTPQEARAALDALPSFGGVPPFIPNRAAQAVLGRVDLLADRLDEAVEALRRGTATCTRLLDATTSTRGWLDLGMALERRGDRAGACDAYRTVLDRWGHARPRSVTADRARQRATALGCR